MLSKKVSEKDIEKRNKQINVYSIKKINLVIVPKNFIPFKCIYIFFMCLYYA